MKKSAVLISIVLVVLVIGAWTVQLTNVAKSRARYNEMIEQGQQYQADGLYQKAMESFEGALSIDENKETRTALVEAGLLAFKDGVFSSKALGKLITTACELYPDETRFWEELLTHYINTNSYTKAYDALLDCQRAGVSSDVIQELGNTIVYSFSVSRKAYATYTRSPQGYITAYDEQGWGVIDPTGERVIDCDFTYISPYNEDLEAVFVSTKGTRLITDDGVVECIINENIVQAKAYSEGLVPYQNDKGQWGYLDCFTGKTVLSGYDDVSSFSDGIAATYKNGKWTLIDENGATVCPTSFDDIKLHSNGVYAFDNIMIASVDGNYGIYDAKGEQVTEFTAKDMDAYYGGQIAYKDSSGSWGFVSKDGTISISAAYENAKSFSNDLAAVFDGNKWGYINGSGALVIDFQFLEASYFSKEGSAMVSNQQGKFSVLKRRFK